MDTNKRQCGYNFHDLTFVIIHQDFYAFYIVHYALKFRECVQFNKLYGGAGGGGREIFWVDFGFSKI